MLSRWFGNKQSDTFTVEIAMPSRSFTLKKGQNLLQAALESGLPAPNNCRAGACKTCHFRLLDGNVRSLIEREYVFTTDEIRGGVHLACQSLVQSNLWIEWQGLAAAIGSGVSDLVSARLESMRSLTPRILRITLQADRPVSWRPGQFMEMQPEEWKDGGRRCYSMVNAGNGEHQLMFDVTRYPNGRMSSWLSDTANIGKTLRLSGPMGNFGFFAEESDFSPLLCIAGGSGIGAVAGLIMHKALQQPRRPVLLVYGGRNQEELYGVQELQQKSKDYGFPLYNRTVLDQEPSDSGWSGRRGRIPEQLLDILHDMRNDDAGIGALNAGWNVLLCGPPPLVQGAIGTLQEQGIPPTRISYDKYEAYGALSAV